MSNNFRAPAVPLVTVDPYFSVWSGADNLYDDYTRHWTGKVNAMTGLCLIDGVAWRFAGKTGLVKEAHYHFTRNEPQGMEQKSVRIMPLSSTYTFEAGGICLEVDFTSPLLLDDLDLLSRPVSYISLSVCSIDGRDHEVRVYFDVTGEWCVDTPEHTDQKVVWGRKNTACYEALYMGTWRQNILGKCGDDLRIDWGYFHLVLPHSANEAARAASCDSFGSEYCGSDKKSCINSFRMRESFIGNRPMEFKDDTRMPRDVYDDMPVMASVMDFGSVGGKPVRDFIMLAYDDVVSIEYYKEYLPGYWRRNGADFDEMLKKASEEYETIIRKCSDRNKKLYSEWTASGGEKYADILSLAYRQAIAAHKLVADRDGKLLFISKECFSNGCAATVDVTYPSMPMFILYNPELVKGMLRPIFKYVNSGCWPFDFAPHDAGRYPMVNGQVYRLEREWKEDGGANNKSYYKAGYKYYGINMEESIREQMPVEECGNMLIAVAAVCQAEGDAGFAVENWGHLTKWAGYLADNGFDPWKQLCTDDFTEKLDHNTNLSLKAIMGIGAYSILCGMKGDYGKRDEYLEVAGKMAAKWEGMAREDDHYKLTFVDKDTWSLKYNMIWDDIFGLNLFPDEVKQRETDWYIKKKNKYGTPLDNRDYSTKSDWLLWAAALARKEEDFAKLMEPLWDFLNESPSRVPFTDRYGTTDRLERSMHHRSVVGGVFIKLLKDRRKNERLPQV